MVLNQLTPEEYKNLKFQFETSKHGGVRKNPYVFTEQGGSSLLISMTSMGILLNISRE